MIFLKQHFKVFDSLIDLLIDEHSTAVASHVIINNFSKFFYLTHAVMS